MPPARRRQRERNIAFRPEMRCYKPCGKRSRDLERIILEADEAEALRLADLEGLYQDACAEQMQVSRSTFSRVVARARHKVADALLHGKMIEIKGTSNTPIRVTEGITEKGTL